MSASREPTPAGFSAHRQRGGIIVRLIGWIFLIVVCFLVYVLREPLLRAAGEIWVVQDARERSDAIILLGDDNYQADRATRVAEVYREGWAPLVVASGRFVRPYASIADLMQRDLTERGVPASAIHRVPSFAGSTREEAVVLRRLAERMRWRRVLVVTSNFHTRRARHILQRVFPPTIEVRIISARDSGYDPENWWRRRIGVKIFANEVFAFPVALWETRSKEAATAGLSETETLPVPPPLPSALPPPIR